MKNLNEKDIRKAIQNLLKEKYEGGYFDEFEFDNDAKQAAMADIQDSGEEFEELGSSKFEKGPEFKEKFKSALKQTNLELSSDEQEVERLAQAIKNKKTHEKYVRPHHEDEHLFIGIFNPVILSAFFF